MEAAAISPNGGQAEALGGALLERPARALIGWMTHEEAVLSQTGRRMDAGDTTGYAERARRAREAVFARKPGIDQEGVVRDAPRDLDEHIAGLRANDAARPMFDEGWEVKLVDLTRVCGFQPNVFTDHAEERVRAVDPGALGSIATAAIPVPQPSQLPLQYDNVKQAWILSAPNPNLRIVGNFNAGIDGGGIGLGFVVRLMPSFLQVVRFEGRYLLRDGYHRAYGFLARGITDVPAFVREFGAIEELVPAGMLPQAAFMGQRPPQLTDYLDDDVSVAVSLPASQKMVVIQGLEITPLG
jgi:hypothetical protein